MARPTALAFAFIAVGCGAIDPDDAMGGSTGGAEPTTGPGDADPSLAETSPSSGGTTREADSGDATTDDELGTSTQGPDEPEDVGIWIDITPPVSLDFADPADNYGTQTIAGSPVAPGTLYLGTCYQGIWKTVDGGESWAKINTGDNGANLETGRNWTLAVDPTDADVVYTVAGYGAGQGLWKSTDGGIGWIELLQGVTAQTTADIYSIAIDPEDHLHLLVGSHSGWAFGGDAGVLESENGGATWILHPPESGWGAGHYVHFIDASTWLLATQNAGHWRTTDSGSSWDQVSDVDMQHGASMLYRASDGALYIGGLQRLLRSVDDGASWTAVGPETSDGYHAVIGDGTYLYAQPANTGAATVGPNPYWFALESDGLDWQPYNEQMFADGPMAMVFDRAQRRIYSSNWRTGVWRLATGH
jgi:hypothetical protein